MIWQTILNFWFKEIDKKKWFIKNKDFDDLVSEKFLIHTERAINGRYDAWNKENNSRLALIILLDQMTRNIFRGSPKSFSGDEFALSLSMNSIKSNHLEIEESMAKRIFILMPLMHSEDIKIQNFSIDYFKRYTNKKTLFYAKRHREVIKEFGRFPHRNNIYGRPSTKDEIKFLKKNSSYF